MYPGGGQGLVRCIRLEGGGRGGFVGKGIGWVGLWVVGFGLRGGFGDFALGSGMAVPYRWLRHLAGPTIATLRVARAGERRTA